MGGSSKGKPQHIFFTKYDLFLPITLAWLSVTDLHCFAAQQSVYHENNSLVPSEGLLLQCSHIEERTWEKIDCSCSCVFLKSILSILQVSQAAHRYVHSRGSERWQKRGCGPLKTWTELSSKQRLTSVSERKQFSLALPEYDGTKSKLLRLYVRRHC